MAPKLIEVDADRKDFFDDALRLATMGLTAWFINSYLLQSPNAGPLLSSMQTMMIAIAGIAVYHLVVDANALRFVVKRTQESYYHAMKRS